MASLFCRQRKIGDVRHSIKHIQHTYNKKVWRLFQGVISFCFLKNVFALLKNDWEPIYNKYIPCEDREENLQKRRQQENEAA